MRYADKACAWLVCLIGLVHLGVGRAAFTAPSPARIWFASAGFLLVVTGLANLAAGGRAGGMQQAAGLAGALSILVLGLLTAIGDRQMLGQPQTLILLALGGILAFQRTGRLIGRR